LTEEPKNSRDREVTFSQIRKGSASERASTDFGSLLEDAAKVDGASHLYIFSRVMVPMVKPAMGVLGLFTFITYWNSFLWPLIIVNTRDRATVPLGLEYFLTQQGYMWNLLMAGGTIAIVPGVILACFLQRWLSQGISLSGLGGR